MSVRHLPVILAQPVAPIKKGEPQMATAQQPHKIQMAKRQPFVFGSQLAMSAPDRLCWPSGGRGAVRAKV
jgi:hypothetical protein